MPEDSRPEEYTPLFCEENIWLLARKLLTQGGLAKRMFVLFFSNPTRSILLLEQKQAPRGHLALWDYHVVLQVGAGEADWIYDYDSRLPFPVPLQTYLVRTFHNPALLPEQYRTLIRKIPATEYLEHFTSDRSHMLGKIPTDAFPDYPCIGAKDSRQPITLADYLDMQKPLPDHSRVFRLAEYSGDLGKGN